MPKRSAIIYIDGFNLYRGICETKDKTLLWYDISKLAKGIIKSNETIKMIRYFTAMPIGDDAKYRRHQGFLDLIHNSNHQPIVHLGKYKRKIIRRKSLDKGVFVRLKAYEEKHSDVALGSYLVRDSILEDCDAAYIISGDKDMLPALRIARQECPSLDLNLRFPPKRRYSEIIADATSQEEIHESVISSARSPLQVTFSCGYRLRMPESWLRDSERHVQPNQPPSIDVNKSYVPFTALGYRRI